MAAGKAAPAVIKQPVYNHLVLEHPIGHAIRFQMVFLPFIHGDEQVAGPGGENIPYHQKQAEAYPVPHNTWV
jgi:hypothetical protein